MQQCVNNHKVQGDTIMYKNIVIKIDEFLLSKDRIDVLLRHLYVAISRVRNSNQIKFFKEDVDLITQTKGLILTHNFL